MTKKLYFMRTTYHHWTILEIALINEIITPTFQPFKCLLITLYVSPKDSVLPVEDRAIAFPSVCFCVVFIKIQNTAFWQHCIYGEYAFSKLTKPLHLHMHRVNSSTTGFPSRIVPTKHIVWY